MMNALCQSVSVKRVVDTERGSRMVGSVDADAA